MPIPEKYIAPFESGAYYHVICKSLPQQKLFLSDENKRFFLERYFHYLSDYLYTYSYILLDNHCHFLVQVKEEEEIVRKIRSVDEDKRTVIQKKFLEENTLITIDALIERQFNSFFVSYTRSFNNLCKIKGHLFDSPFRRISVADESHLVQLVIYIHANAMRHRLTNNISEYKWSTYNKFITDEDHFHVMKNVMDWFGGKKRS